MGDIKKLPFKHIQTNTKLYQYCRRYLTISPQTLHKYFPYGQFAPQPQYQKYPLRYEF